ncbi:MAG: NAD(P)-binding domain-containing protein [Myxococcota bacterium]
MGGSTKVCVVGGGPAGMAMVRSLLARGIEFDCFERHTDVGGIWDQQNPGSPVYDSAHFISSKTQSHYFDFPMPKEFPDYPSHRQILAYMHSFADVYGLRDHVHFGTGVASTDRTETGWVVETSDGKRRTYDALICATGTNWHGVVPEFKGEFTGELRHSNTYRSTSELSRKRVLVIGAGNSGVDIACDASQAASHAAISLRRGYHFIPKHLFGMPADAFAAQGPSLPLWLEQRAFGALLRFLHGDVSRLGLPTPDHRLFESHPIMNTQLLHYLAHGDITAKPDVDRFDGQMVHFVDGTSDAFDVVLCATGYRWSIPYVDPRHFSWRGNRPDLYLNLFSRTDDALYALGFMETNGGAYKLFDEMADLISQAIASRGEGTADRFERLVQTDRPDLTGGIQFVGSDRHATYVEISTYRKQMARIRRRLRWPVMKPGMFDALRVPTALSAVA